MSTTWVWALVLLFAAIKIPIGLLMLWLPFRNEQRALANSVADENEDASDEEEGGSRTLPASPIDPHPRRPLSGPQRPRRGGPHGAPTSAPSPRVRHGRPSVGTRV
jgi:hypothetical protein